MENLVTQATLGTKLKVDIQKRQLQNTMQNKSKKSQCQENKNERCATPIQSRESRRCKQLLFLIRHTPCYSWSSSVKLCRWLSRWKRNPLV